MIDAADVGGKFTIKVGDTRSTATSPTGCGSRTATSTWCRSCSPRPSIRLTRGWKHTNDINDGFGVDGGGRRSTSAPIPLPPGLLLMLPALGLLAAARRRPRQA